MHVDEPLPGWLTTSATLLIGAGGAKILAVWLENRRLTRREYRETLLGRVQELESVVGSLQTRVANLRVEIAHLQEQLDRERELVERLSFENDQLRGSLQDTIERDLEEPRGDPPVQGR